MSPTDHAGHCLLLPRRSMVQWYTIWGHSGSRTPGLRQTLRHCPQVLQYPENSQVQHGSSVSSTWEGPFLSAQSKGVQAWVRPQGKYIIHGAGSWELSLSPELEYKHKDRCPYARGLAQPRAQSQAPTATACGHCVCQGPAVLMGPLGAVLWFLPLPTCARNWPPKATSGYFIVALRRPRCRYHPRDKGPWSPHRETIHGLIQLQAPAGPQGDRRTESQVGATTDLPSAELGPHL